MNPCRRQSAVSQSFSPAPLAWLLPWHTASRQDPKALPKADAKGNPIRFAKKTGHISNYDEAKVKPYTLPDPLILSSGRQQGAQTRKPGTRSGGRKS